MQCGATPFPAISAAPGPATTVAPVYVFFLLLSIVRDMSMGPDDGPFPVPRPKLPPNDDNRTTRVW